MWFLKKKIGDTSQTVAGEILPIDFLHNRSLFGDNVKQSAGGGCETIYFSHH